MGISEGLVVQIQRMSTEDGPGLRSTAFFKGCPLACAWCHNPETIEPRPEIQWIGSRCIAGATVDGCGACVAACPRGSLSRPAEGGVSIDRSSCTGCGACAEACPSGAMELVGTRMSAGSLAAELLKDRAWFAASDRGGVTLSGGEASAQAGFARETLRILSEAGIQTALDTCGMASWESLSSLYPHTNLVLYDLKEIDTARHEAFTGRGNERVLDNLRRTVAYMRSHARPEALWIRTPVIPGATDTEDNLRGLGRAIAGIAGGRDRPSGVPERWELCAFNNLCADKYARLGKPWAFGNSPLMMASDMDRLAEAARLGLRDGGMADDSMVSWTGTVRVEREGKEETCATN